MPIDTLSASTGLTFSWSAEDNLVGEDYSPLSNTSNVNSSISFLHSTANTELGGANLLSSFIEVIPASGTATIDLQNILNILQQTGQNYARVKSWCMRLLSTGNDTTNGTDCSSVTVGNAASNRFDFNLSAAATVTLNNGGFLIYGDESATGFTVSGTNKDILVTNNDASNAAAFQIVVIGGDS